jgi:AbrB family looped-hinge helix DNA binding protein
MSEETVEVSSVYEKGQTVIPKAIREVAGIAYGTRLQWEVREGVIQVVPIPKDPVRASEGLLKGKGLTFRQFLKERQEERRLEREREASEAGSPRARPWPTSSTPRRS